MVKELYSKITEKLSIKLQGILGPDKTDGDIDEAKILNRIVGYKQCDDGNWAVTWEADPRHSAIISKQLGLDEKSRGVTTPGDKGNDKIKDEPLDLENAKW